MTCKLLCRFTLRVSARACQGNRLKSVLLKHHEGKPSHEPENRQRRLDCAGGQATKDDGLSHDWTNSQAGFSRQPIPKGRRASTVTVRKRARSKSAGRS